MQIPKLPDLAIQLVHEDFKYDKIPNVPIIWTDKKEKVIKEKG